MKIKTKIVFVCSDRNRDLGSTVMRSAQMIELISPEMLEEAEFSLSYIPRSFSPKGRFQRLLWAREQPRDAIFFFTKNTISTIRPTLSHILKSKGGRICADYVDGDISALMRSTIDVHIASSFTSARQIADVIAMKSIHGETCSPEICTILHGADTRLGKIRRRKHEGLRMAYIGDPQNCAMSAELKEQIDILEASTSTAFEHSLRYLPEYNAHYCLRPTEDKRFVTKPFTKGMTASACAAVPLVQRDTPDAELMLGSDYPFFVDGTSSKAAENMYQTMRDEFDGPLWHQALAATLEMGNLTSASATARSMREMIGRLT